MSHFNITSPEDYQKYFHVNEQGHVWLDGGNNPIPLTQNVTKRINSIPPKALWSGRHTRSGVHSKDTPPHMDGPHNSTGNTQAPPSLGTLTRPIPTDQEIQRDIIQGILDDPKIPKSLLGKAGKKLKIFSAPTKLTNKCHNIPQIILILPTWAQHNLHIVPIPPQECNIRFKQKFKPSAN